MSALCAIPITSHYSIICLELKYLSSLNCEQLFNTIGMNCETIKGQVESLLTLKSIRGNYAALFTLLIRTFLIRLNNDGLGSLSLCCCRPSLNANKHGVKIRVSTVANAKPPAIAVAN